MRGMRIAPVQPHLNKYMVITQVYADKLCKTQEQHLVQDFIPECAALQILCDDVC